MKKIQVDAINKCTASDRRVIGNASIPLHRAYAMALALETFLDDLETDDAGDDDDMETLGDAVEHAEELADALRRIIYKGATS